jgi:heterodisulfide reductase subunit C
MSTDKADALVYEEFDHQFKDEVAKKIGLEEIKPCYTCGACTAVCPVHEVIEDFDPRRMIHMILLGMRKEILSSDLLWFCCLCNSCYFVCPQQIKFGRVATELRKTAQEEHLVDEGFLKNLKELNPYLQDLCRRTLFRKVRDGFCGQHTMPCWRKHTSPNSS